MNHMAGAILALSVTMATSISQAEVVVTGAWVRATVVSQKATGAFMKLVSDNDVTLELIRK